jgi:hypothetical protein
LIAGIADGVLVRSGLLCVNTRAQALLQQIVQADAGALIILQSDHGTAFRDQFEKPPDGLVRSRPA